MINLSGFELNTSSILLFALAAFLTGFAKAGMKGTGLIIVPLMAALFGAKASTGILLPMLIVADIMAVIYYRKHARWKYIIKLLPWTAIGIIGALIIGNEINENQFRIILTTIVIIMLALMIINDFRKKQENIPDGKIFAIIMGIAGGFATMIGNSAGPIFTVYFLAMGMPKKEFIGTGAWFFLIINLGKVPLHAIFWKTIDIQTLVLNSLTIPIIALGIAAGLFLVKLFPEKAYRYFVIIATLISALVLFI